MSDTIKAFIERPLVHPNEVSKEMLQFEEKQGELITYLLLLTPSQARNFLMEVQIRVSGQLEKRAYEAQQNAESAMTDYHEFNGGAKVGGSQLKQY
jgi:hypothetical protein